MDKAKNMVAYLNNRRPVRSKYQYSISRIHMDKVRNITSTWYFYLLSTTQRTNSSAWFWLYNDTKLKMTRKCDINERRNPK